MTEIEELKEQIESMQEQLDEIQKELDKKPVNFWEFLLKVEWFQIAIFAIGIYTFIKKV